MEKLAGMELVTNVRVNVIARESARRAEAETKAAKYALSDKYANVSVHEAGYDENLPDDKVVGKGPYALYEV